MAILVAVGLGIIAAAYFGLSSMGRLPSIGDRTSGESPQSEAWVTAERLNRRTCPSADCGSVGQFFSRDRVDVFEEKDGWVRVSQYYDASCWAGVTEYVDSGNDACTEENGVVDGRFAEWVSSEYLSPSRPPDPAAGATGMNALVANSDDYARYGDSFARAVGELIASQQCSRADFEEMGGWLKSSFHDGPIYFTYCRGMTIQNRIYLNAESGEVFR